METKAVIAVVIVGSQASAVRFPNAAALREWEDNHPEVEVVSSMPLVSRTSAERAAR